MNVWKKQAYQPAQRKYPANVKSSFYAKPKSGYGAGRGGKTSGRSSAVYALPRRSYAPLAVRETSAWRQPRSSTRHRSERSRGASVGEDREIGPAPDRYFCRLKWGEAYTFSSAITNRQVWAGNGASDPNLGTGNSEPLGWDQLQTLYTQYVCYGSRIKLRFSNSATKAVEWVLYPRTDTTSAPATYLEARQNKYAKWGTIGAQGSGKDIQTVEHRMLTRKMFGETTVTDDPTFQAVTSGGTAPASVWYWQLVCVVVDGASTLNLTVDIAMVFDLEFRQFKYLPIPVNP
jgi:hypothetical protein